MSNPAWGLEEVSLEQSKERLIEVSIIICVYNAEKTIAATLACVCAAKLPNCEVLVIDDGSTDCTSEQCLRYQVKVVRMAENRGPAAARNLGVRLAKGPILFFIDSDATFEPKLLPRMLNFLQAYPTLVGVGSLSCPVPLNPTFYSHYFAIQESVLDHEILGVLPTAKPYIVTRCGCIKKTVVEELGGFNEQYRKPSAEDYEFSLRMPATSCVLFDGSLVNCHHFPATFWAIATRYYSNAREIASLYRNHQIAIQPFQRDGAARLLFLSSLGAAILAILVNSEGWRHYLLAVASLHFLAAMVTKSSLITQFLEYRGLGFTILGWLFYCLCTIPIACGGVAGIAGRVLDKLKHRIKDRWSVAGDAK